MADESQYTESDIWTSPNHNAPLAERPKTPKTPKTPKSPTAQSERRAEPVDRDAALRKELQGVRSINESLEGVIATLERAGGNMNIVSQTVANASTLLNTWTRMLSQTEHNQRLILHPSWKGTTEDLAEQEAEALRKQQAEIRKAAEEEERKQELRRRREEEEEKRRLGTATSTRGSRGITGSRGSVRGRTRAGSIGRGASSSSTSAGASSSSRGTSNIGRGFGTNRGRSRGVR